MSKYLVVVESPAKARTINKILGSDYTVKASMGHIKDLPKNKIGVDEKHNFAPTYLILPDKEKILKSLKLAARGKETIFLAADHDREGEAICQHLYEELKSQKNVIVRVLFNEITRNAILRAFEEPGEIDANKVNAQQARRILDRLVGYKISPLLWDKVKRGLSGGRVQSITMRLICDREKEIEAFVPEEYWTIAANLSGKEEPAFEAKLVRKGDRKISLKSGEEAAGAKEELEKERFLVAKVTKEAKKRNPQPPFVTAKLQQEAVRRLGFTARKTMQVAQRLYEGKHIQDVGDIGLITYMRTDSTRVSNEALEETSRFITGHYGENYLQTRVFKNKKKVQDAHEAIRPTLPGLTPDSINQYLSPDEFKLYQLIWNRFVASQMASAVFNVTTVDVRAGEYVLRARGDIMAFDGFMKVYDAGNNPPEDEKAKLPPLMEGETLRLNELVSERHETKPPPRYTEATLVKELEENGIGRPSTYAAIVYTIQNRDYAQKEKGKFLPTSLGKLVTELLQANFSELMDVEYTAKLEDRLDDVEQGRLHWVDALKGFYDDFEKDLQKATENMESFKQGIETDETCEECGAKMMTKMGKFGPFLTCSKYPECKFTREMEEPAGENGSSQTGEVCEKCGRPMVVKRGRFGKFLACSGYPECKTTKKIAMDQEGNIVVREEKILDETCPRCGALLKIKHGRFGEFTACSNYPECKYIKQKELSITCPNEGCGGDILERKTKRGRIFYGCSKYPECKFVSWYLPAAIPCPQCHYPVLFEKTTKKKGKVRFCAEKDCGYEKQVVEQEVSVSSN